MLSASPIPGWGDDDDEYDEDYANANNFGKLPSLENFGISADTLKQKAVEGNIKNHSSMLSRYGSNLNDLFTAGLSREDRSIHKLLSVYTGNLHDHPQEICVALHTLGALLTQKDFSDTQEVSKTVDTALSEGIRYYALHKPGVSGDITTINSIKTELVKNANFPNISHTATMGSDLSPASTFESMIASFSIAICGGKAGAVIQFPSGHSITVMGNGSKEVYLVDHHLRNPETGGMPSLGSGNAIVVKATSHQVLTDYVMSFYAFPNNVGRLRYEATLFTPGVSSSSTTLKEKEEEDSGVVAMKTVDTADNLNLDDVIPMDIDNEKVVINDIKTEKKKKKKKSPSSKSQVEPETDFMIMEDDDDEEGQISSDGKRGRNEVIESPMRISAESHESEEKKVKSTPKAIPKAKSSKTVIPPVSSEIVSKPKPKKKSTRRTVSRKSKNKE